MQQQQSFMRRQWKKNGTKWAVVFFICSIPVASIGAVFFWSWYGLLAFVLLSIATGMGVTLGFHRYLTHKGFETSYSVRILLTLIGQQAFEGSAIDWVANHNKHHKYSDCEDDPHSPIVDGFLFSHVLWIFVRSTAEEKRQHYRTYAKALIDDPIMWFLHYTFLLQHAVMFAALYFLGVWIEGSTLGWSLLFWGGPLRMLFVLNSTWLINSATHSRTMGYQTFETPTKDFSRNNWWLAIITFGEGLHNNHHAFPIVARYGYNWKEMLVDSTYWVIWLMKKTRIIWNVKDDLTKHVREDKRVKTGVKAEAA